MGLDQGKCDLGHPQARLDEVMRDQLCAVKQADMSSDGPQEL